MPTSDDDSPAPSSWSSASSHTRRPLHKDSMDNIGAHSTPIARGTFLNVHGKETSSTESDSTMASIDSIDAHLVPNPVTPARPGYPSFISPSAFISPADSPSASVTLLRANETLAGLSRQLGELEQARLLESDPDLSARGCCCGALADCPTLASRDRVDAKLKLCGEIGTALLQRYEALEQKYQRAEKQVEIKRKALADSLRHVANLERANTGHLSKYTDLTRAYEGLEKRYTQAMHTQTLTQQSLTHVRNELAKTRAATNAQNLSHALDKANDDRLADAERRFEDARTLYHAESRKLREELKWRRMAEDRIADLETKLTAAGREVEDVKAARAKDAQDLLANAKERLETLHSELSETFHSDHPSDTPEYQRTLEDLVATNALLKHDTSELARTLSHTLEENRALKDECDELRIISRRSTSRPLSSELRPLLMRGTSGQGHGRTVSTGSNPIPAASDASRLLGHARVVSAAAPRTTGMGHRRDSSTFASHTSSTDGIVSPPSVLGLNSLGDSPFVVDSHGRPMSPELRHSLQSRSRSSSGGIGYVHNGVPRVKRPRPRTSIDNRRSLSMRTCSIGESITEPEDSNSVNSVSEGGQSVHSGDDSAASETNPSASTKRASVLLPGMTPSPKLLYEPSPDGGTAYDLPPYTYSESTTDKKRLGRRTLLLLSRSMGVQTEPILELRETPIASPAKATETEPKEGKSQKADPNMPGTPRDSETSSLHARRPSMSGPMPSVAELVEFLTKVLTRLRGVDIPTLNRRLKKQNLPSDVGHVSRSTISSLQTEIGNMRHRFRGLLDQSTVTRRELGLLLVLLRDVFTDMLELQLTVNNVTLDPKLAKKLRREAFEDDSAKEAAEASTGFWGIAAPITNYFLPTTQKASEPVPPASPSKRRIASSRIAPKMPPSTSASTASVTVGFGGASATGPAPKTTGFPSSKPPLPPTNDVFTDERLRSVSAPVTASNARSVRIRSKESNRNLKGIFAGSQGVPGSLGAPPRIRNASSQYFTHRAVSDRPRERLSTIVDAVLDPATESAIDDGDTLLERRLRPRGLSDSSIRSTAIDHSGAAPLTPAVSAAAHPLPARAVAVVTTRVGGVGSVATGMLGTISRRIYGPPVAEKVLERTTSSGVASAETHSPSASQTTSQVVSTAASENVSTAVSPLRKPSTLPIPTAIPTTATTTVAICTSTGVSPGEGLLANGEHDRVMEAAIDAAVSPFNPGSVPRW